MDGQRRSEVGDRRSGGSRCIARSAPFKLCYTAVPPAVPALLLTQQQLFLDGGGGLEQNAGHL